MMTHRIILAALATAVLATSACGGDEPKKDVEGGDTLALGTLGDTSLAGLDTTDLAAAADVAMAEEPGSVTSVLGETPGTVSAPRPSDTIPATEPIDAPATVPAPAPSTPAPAPATTRASTPTTTGDRARSTPVPEPSRPRPTTAPTTATRTPAPSSPAPRTTASAPRTTPARAVAPRASARACESPAREDQRRCLMGYLAVSDVDLNNTYQELITQLKRNAGTAAGAREPDQVQRLREAQRAWLVYRDRECRSRNRGREGPLWAPVRAYCLSEFTEAREAELQTALRRARRGQPIQ